MYRDQWMGSLDGNNGINEWEQWDHQTGTMGSLSGKTEITGTMGSLG